MRPQAMIDMGAGEKVKNCVKKNGSKGKNMGLIDKSKPTPEPLRKSEPKIGSFIMPSPPLAPCMALPKRSKKNSNSQQHPTAIPGHTPK